MKPINKIIKIFIYSDLLVLSGFGVLAPIFAIFISQKILGGGASVAGFAAAIYWLIKSALQIPIGLYLDKNHGEKDDLCFVVIGLILAAFAPLGFIFAFLPWHIYALQALYAFGMGIAGALGGILASAFGFQIVFVFVSVLAFVGAILPIFAYKFLKH